jgi:rubrerythrin
MADIIDINRRVFERMVDYIATESDVSMRRMISRRCRSCDFEWLAPSPRGACPRCHQPNVENVLERVNELDRV